MLIVISGRQYSSLFEYFYFASKYPFQLSSQNIKKPYPSSEMSIQRCNSKNKIY